MPVKENRPQQPDEHSEHEVLSHLSRAVSAVDTMYETPVPLQRLGYTPAQCDVLRRLQEATHTGMSTHMLHGRKKSYHNYAIAYVTTQGFMRYAFRCDGDYQVIGMPSSKNRLKCAFINPIHPFLALLSRDSKDGIDLDDVSRRIVRGIHTRPASRATAALAPLFPLSNLPAMRDAYQTEWVKGREGFVIVVRFPSDGQQHAFSRIARIESLDVWGMHTQPHLVAARQRETAPTQTRTRFVSDAL